MKCEHCNSQLSMYADGRLAGAAQREVDQHLAVCRRCREDLREIQQLRGLLSRLPVPEARSEFWDEALRTVRTRGRRAGPRWTPSHAYGAAAAAAALALVFIVSRPDRPAYSPAPPPAEITIDPVSFISLHTRERGRSPLVDLAKVRAAGSEAESVDIADNGRFDVE